MDAFEESFIKVVPRFRCRMWLTSEAIFLEEKKSFLMPSYNCYHFVQRGSCKGHSIALMEDSNILPKTVAEMKVEYLQSVR